MLQIVSVKQSPVGTQEALDYIHRVWNGNNQASNFFDMITKVSLGDEEMGNFYVLLQDNEVIGCCGLVTHDVVTSRNFYPWVTSLYIDEAYRGRNYGQLLLNHVGHQAQLMGYQKLYLTTGKTDYYRRNGWQELDQDISRKKTHVYYKVLQEQKSNKQEMMQPKSHPKHHLKNGRLHTFD